MIDKKIYIDKNNKLVVQTDNGIITADKIDSKIEGYFKVEDKDVVKLLAIVNQKDVVYPYFETLKLNGDNETYKLLSFRDDCIKQEIDNAKQFIKDLEQKLQQAENIINLSKLKEERIKDVEKECNRIHEQIKEFNNSRHWWERKLKIKINPFSLF